MISSLLDGFGCRVLSGSSIAEEVILGEAPVLKSTCDVGVLEVDSV